MKPEFKLITEITKRSTSDNWEDVKKEWSLVDVIILDDGEYETCLCGHYPIKELCFLQNQENGNAVIVGNCCVNKFMGVKSNSVFAAIKRVKENITKAFNNLSVDLAYREEWINDWEYSFYCNTMRKRKLTDKQLNKRTQINRKILNKFEE